MTMGSLTWSAPGVVYEGPIEMGFDTYTGTPGNFSYAGRDDPGQAIHALRLNQRRPNDYSLVPINDASAVRLGRPWPGSPTDPNLYKVQPAVFAKLQADLAAHMSTRRTSRSLSTTPRTPTTIPTCRQTYEPRGSSRIPRVAQRDHHHPECHQGRRADPDQHGSRLQRGRHPRSGLQQQSGLDLERRAAGEVVGSRDSGQLGQGEITVNGPTNRAMMVRENDIIVGYMLDFLEQTDDPRNPGHKLIDNTIFIFTSDNGADIRSEAAVGALPDRVDDSNTITDLTGFKGTRWEGGNRVPFIAAWPKPGDPAPRRTASRQD
jgi:hypothetical protein